MNSPLKSDTITELNVFNCIFSYQSQFQQNAQEVNFIHLNYQKFKTLQWMEILNEWNEETFLSKGI